ncbi:hypothetical protein MLD38_020458 [Melastoma candidum]|uniref:Uncharacterized protein n=1 Tax=Melastoma candidum TaxID=119954 RepID=A0ACB9QGT4_9MYRT|nr:hypothetical protein MLD38_020458 [Melastoma candidum]
MGQALAIGSFSVEDMALEIAENRFKVEPCCVLLTPSRKKGESLVLPDLRLKVLIEALRMVLEVVYDERLMTFCYGGRVGMGRHTAVRYLKNSVENATWWFAAKFERQSFEVPHMERLCRVLEEKIDDCVFVELIRKLFDSNVVRIELGRFSLGQGFPQESGLCGILINVYFSGLDREIQEFRLRVNRESQNVDAAKIPTSSNVSYRPAKVYAVRYLDEILIATSGSKVLMMDLRKKILDRIESDLGLKVDGMRSTIRSAVSDKLEFLGMELQAVPPSVLNPPMTEKEVRARKKYLRQKEVQAQERRNARERNRRKLGMKILSHLFRKLKRNDGFRLNLPIEDEVRAIFSRWANETVQEFFHSLEERYNWHRMLTAGNFMSLRHIRDQLPAALVDAYDEFQAQIDKHLSPFAMMAALEEEEREKEEETERKYADQTANDLTRTLIKVDAPIQLVRKAVKLAGFTNNMGRPRPIKLLLALEDADIIKWYAGVGRRWLEYFCCCHNFRTVKIVVSYHLRFSCILTLQAKHESTKQEAIKHYTKDLIVTGEGENEVAYFPTEKEVKMMGDRNLSNPMPIDGALTLALVRLASDVEPPYPCAAHFCSERDTRCYRIRLLQNRLNVNPANDEKWVPGMGAIHESFNRKLLALCPRHRDDLFLGGITLQDIDITTCWKLDAD